MKRRIFLVAIGALTAACAAAPHAEKSNVAEVAIPPDAPPPVPQELAALPNRQAKLSFDLGYLAPVPLVHGTIGGKSSWMLVDSGASTQFIASWMARRAKVQTSPTDMSVSDHVRHDLNVALADRPRVDSRARSRNHAHRIRGRCSARADCEKDRHRFK